ncbi:MAG TPA: hypothetical protein VKB05_14115 [Pyrinomonadaceae bacterium]|nr:hypothetical protein [Pyrinomonadaceae bacterium]
MTSYRSITTPKREITKAQEDHHPSSLKQIKHAHSSGNLFTGYPYGYAYGYYGQYVFGDSVAADSQGYHDGLRTGEEDAHHGRNFDPERSHYFKDAGFGNFAQAYRDGFGRGYDAGFRS